MELEEASKIVKIWGTHLEYVGGKLMIIFGAHIPESFLPYPKSDIEDALNMLAKHYYDNGDKKASEDLQSSMGSLTLYRDDEEALITSAKLFSEDSWRKSMIESLHKFQQNWISDHRLNN